MVGTLTAVQSHSARTHLLTALCLQPWLAPHWLLCMTALYFLYLSLDRLHCNCASGFKMQREVDSETSESRSKRRQTETKGTAPVLREASGSCSPKTIRVLLVSDSHFVRGSEDVIGQTAQ